VGGGRGGGGVAGVRELDAWSERCRGWSGIGRVCVAGARSRGEEGGGGGLGGREEGGGCECVWV
jgi:hypothetical protein